MKPALIHAVIDQIRRDLDLGDSTALEELLKNTPEKDLREYLPEFLQEE